MLCVDLLMNKLFFTLSVLCASIHCMHFGMDPELELQIRKRDQIRALIIQKSKDKERQEFNKQENFLRTFGQKSINRTGRLFCDLSLGSKQKVVSLLSYNQNLLVWFGAQDLDIPILVILCNGNEYVARMERDMPINRVLEEHAWAKEKIRWYPIRGLHLDHYMVLQDSEGRMLRDTLSNKMIHYFDIATFMDILKKLKRIDPVIEGLQDITDRIRIYPSDSEQIVHFYNVPAPINDMVHNYLAISILSFIGIRCLRLGPDWSHSQVGAYCFTAGMPVPVVCGLWDKYEDFCIHLKNNVFPNQPTLTDFLKKQGIYE